MSFISHCYNDLNESRLMSFSKGSYIITAINGNDRITRKFVIK